MSMSGFFFSPMANLAVAVVILIMYFQIQLASSLTGKFVAS